MHNSTSVMDKPYITYVTIVHILHRCGMNVVVDRYSSTDVHKIRAKNITDRPLIHYTMTKV